MPTLWYCTELPPIVLSIAHGRAAGQITTTCKPKGVFMKTAKDVLKSIKDNDVKYVDLRFTDPRGKWQHVTFDTGLIDDDAFAQGLMFDGSSLAGWKRNKAS